MRSPFTAFSDAEIAAFVTARWDTDVAAIEYVPEGGGAYHWVANTSDGRWFITCDDLEVKPWLGSSHDEVFAGLTNAYAAAVALRAEGLAFVVAPRPSAAGAVAERLDDRHSVAVFDHVDGEPGRWGEPAPADTHAVVTMLGALHGARPSANLARRGLDVPGRATLEDALRHLDEPWRSGPYGEPARAEVAAHAEWIAAALARLDRLAARLPPGDVVTHGEPHPGNLIRTADGVRLVDWDTVAIARPERDLWMVALVDPSLPVDRDAVEAYRLLWALADVAAFTRLLNAPHPEHVDAARSLVALQRIFAGTEPAPFGGSHSFEP